MHSQDLKNESETVKTKMDAFVYKTGVITMFTDFTLGDIESLMVLK